MQHITLTSGDVRWSPREEVDDGLMRLLVDHLSAGLHATRTAPAPIPRMDGYAMHGTTDGNVLMASISQWHAEAWMPILTIAAVPADAPVQRIAGLLTHAGDAPRELPRPGPWCLVRLYDTAALVPPEDLLWMGDYERCLAWAWLESGVGAEDRRH